MDPFELVGHPFLIVYFESNPVVEYAPELDNYIDDIGNIVEYDYHNDLYHIEIKKQVFEYPAYVVQEQFNDKAMQALKTILKS